MAKPKITIPIGSRFGKLIAIGPEAVLGTHSAMTCKCDCGTVKIITVSNLIGRQSKSCGCLKLTAKYHNLIGKQFGKLVVLDDSLIVKRHRAAKCRCSCGAECITLIHAMVDGRVVSCGCHRKAMAAYVNYIHGGARHRHVAPEYVCWSEMKRRCLDANHEHYRDYGGRGIVVCNRWKEYVNFVADMGPRPSLQHSIDRYPDNDGNYEPGNCRWATRIEQANNRRVTPMIEYQGRTQSIADWARELGLKYWSLRNRIVNLGWAVQRSIETPFTVGRNQFS